MKKIVLLTLWMGLLLGFKTKPEQAELQTILEKLSAANKPSGQEAFTMSYKLYEGLNYSGLITQLNGLLIQDSRSKYCQLGEVESLELPDFFIGIDREDKVLLLANGNKQTNRPLHPDQIEKYLSLCKSYKLEKTSALQNKLTLILKQGAQDKVELFYSNSQYKIEKMNLYFTVAGIADGLPQNQKLEIVYTPNPSIHAADSRLQLNHYLLYRNGNWIPQGKFRGYELINNLIAS